MGRFVSPNGVTFSVDDSKDERYDGYDAAEAVKAPTKKAAAKKAAPSES